jgi:hypothetical protein
MALTGHPPHRSGRAVLPHPALVSGSDAFTYALQLLLHPIDPALRPGGWVPLHIPLDWQPSLHLLRIFRFVRRLPRYYAAIRLPVFVYHWLASSDFPMQPSSPSSHWANTGSPDSRTECFQACMGSPTPQSPLPARAIALAVWPSPFPNRVGALVASFLSGLNTHPACSPVNASPVEFPLPAHDSGPIWFAGPLLFETFTLFTLRRF